MIKLVLGVVMFIWGMVVMTGVVPVTDYYTVGTIWVVGSIIVNLSPNRDISR